MSARLPASVVGFGAFVAAPFGLFEHSQSIDVKLRLKAPKAIPDG